MRQLFFIFCFLILGFASKASYLPNDGQITVLFEAAVEINYDQFDQIEQLESAGMNLHSVEREARDQYITAILAGCFGWSGLHRWYLGTSWGTKVAYCFIGGCLFYVDFWVIMVDCVIKGNGTIAYENNSKLLMWK